MPRCNMWANGYGVRSGRCGSGVDLQGAGMGSKAIAGCPGTPSASLVEGRAEVGVLVPWVGLDRAVEGQRT